jgi:hypothetical protein
MRRVEMEIREKASNITSRLSSPISMPAIPNVLFIQVLFFSLNFLQLGFPELPERSNTAQSARPSCRQDSLPPSLPAGSEWEALTIFQDIEHEKVEAEKNRKKAQNKKDLAASLSAQVEEQRKLRRQERQDDIAYFDSLRRDAQKYQEDLRASIVHRQETNAAQLKEFKEQVCSPAILPDSPSTFVVF